MSPSAWSAPFPFFLVPLTFLLLFTQHGKKPETGGSRPASSFFSLFSFSSFLVLSSPFLFAPQVHNTYGRLATVEKRSGPSFPFFFFLSRSFLRLFSFFFSQRSSRLHQRKVAEARAPSPLSFSSPSVFISVFFWAGRIGMWHGFLLSFLAFSFFFFLPVEKGRTGDRAKDPTPFFSPLPPPHFDFFFPLDTGMRSGEMRKRGQRVSGNIRPFFFFSPLVFLFFFPIFFFLSGRTAGGVE